MEATAGALEVPMGGAPPEDSDKLSHEANEYRNWCKLMEMNALKNLATPPGASGAGGGCSSAGGSVGDEDEEDEGGRGGLMDSEGSIMGDDKIPLTMASIQCCTPSAESAPHHQRNCILGSGSGRGADLPAKMGHDMNS